MRTIRRLYVYLVSFISLEVVIWGLIGLARSIVGGRLIGSDAGQLAGALSLIAVGVPVFVLHWWLAQRTIEDVEERFARLRAIFLYGALLSTLIPIAQNVLALLNRLWLQIFNLPLRMAFVGQGQTWGDNLIAILMNALMAAYFFTVLRKDWAAAPQGDAFAETRRLYRYIWVVYSLAMVVGGIQQTMQYILNLAETIGEGSGVNLANGLSLAILGTSLWLYSGRKVQASLAEPQESRAILRLVILYGLSLIGLAGVLVPAGIVLDAVFRTLFGEATSFSRFLSEISEPLSAAIPFGGMWAYYGRILADEVAALPDVPRRAGLRRLYYYILTLVGLVATFVGLNALLSFVIDTMLQTTTWVGALRVRLSGSLATLAVGLPLWLFSWQPIVKEVSQEGEAGDHARRSLVRKFFLYLVIFAGVIGVMVSAGSLIFQLLSALLGDPPDNFERAPWMLLELLVLFSMLLVYHWMRLRADGRMAAQSLAARHAAFPVLVLASEMGPFSRELLNVFQRETPSLPVVVHSVHNGVPDETLSGARVVILPGELAANPTEATRLWLQAFNGIRLVVPTPAEDWLWTFGSGRPLADLARQTAKMVRHLAEGEELPKTQETSPWMVVFYILAGIIGIPLLISLFSALSRLLY